MDETSLTAESLKDAITALASPEFSEVSSCFFKTGEGQYGYGDRFLGVRVPQIRATIRPYRSLPPAEVRQLLESPFHEHRMPGVLIWAHQGPAVVEEYVEALRAGRVNNWDLVDASAHRVVGAAASDDGDWCRLVELARDEDLWVRRVGIVATWYPTKRGDPSAILEVAPHVLGDSRDLIQKATGWMLREMGKACGQDLMREFLDEHAAVMPRTQLRYAIEKFDPEERARYRAMGDRSQK